MARNKVLPNTFINEFGESINPGDSVVVVTSGRGGSVGLYKGRYVGYFKSKTWRGTDGEVRVVVETQEEHSVNRHPTTGAEYDPNKDHPTDIELGTARVGYDSMPRYGGGGPRIWGRPTPDEQREREEYNRKYAEWVKAHNAYYHAITLWIATNYPPVKELYWHRRTLQRNRIVKNADTLVGTKL